MGTMTHQSQNQALTRLQIIGRKPQRISITLPYHVWKELQDLADEEGRSLSNLSVFIVEQGLVIRRTGTKQASTLPRRMTG